MAAGEEAAFTSGGIEFSAGAFSRWRVRDNGCLPSIVSLPAVS